VAVAASAVVAAAVVVVVVVVAAEGGDPTSRSSTISSCSADWPTALATIASAIRAAIAPMSA